MARNMAEQRELIAGFAGKIEGALAQIRKDVERNTDDIREIKQDVHNLYGEVGEIKGDVKALSARLDTQQMKFGWYLAVFGLIITVAVAALQLWK